MMLTQGNHALQTRFYGKNGGCPDRLIEIGSKENNISGSRTYDAFGEVLAKNFLVT